MAASRSDSALCRYDDDLKPQLISWAVAVAAGASWLVLVHLTVLPAPPKIEPPTASGPIDVIPGWTTAIGNSHKQSLGSASGDTKIRLNPLSPTAPLGVAGAFAATVVTRLTGDVAALIGRVQTVSGAIASSGLAGEKAVLSTGTAHATPGISTFGRGDAKGKGSAVGAVAPGGAISRAEVRVQALPIVAPPELGGAMVDQREAGAFVRARVAQLQYCYESTVRAGQADLAGVITLRLTLGAGGVVRDAEIVRRTWSGKEAEETEACLLATARRWRVPTGEEGASFSLPISFTRAR